MQVFSSSQEPFEVAQEMSILWRNLKTNFGLNEQISGPIKQQLIDRID